jgi:hypothetical protein
MVGGDDARAGLFGDLRSPVGGVVVCDDDLVAFAKRSGGLMDCLQSPADESLFVVGRNYKGDGWRRRGAGGRFTHAFRACRSAP